VTDPVSPDGGLALEAQAHALLERVRSGELTLEWVRLAAWLGHGVARAALGSDAPVQPRQLDPMKILAAAPFATEGFRSEVVWRAFFAAHQEAVVEWDEHLSDSGGRIGMFWATARKVEAELVAGWPIVGDIPCALVGVGDSVWFAGEVRVWAAITRELVTWALGEGDPVCERAQGRGRSV